MCITSTCWCAWPTGHGVGEQPIRVEVSLRQAASALQAEELRRRADQEAAVDRAGVSGTAAAFDGGADPEPHQTMEYTANVPTGMAM